jgi:uncharacterized protein (DUF1778 family)
MRLVAPQRLELRLTDNERDRASAAETAVGETLSDFFHRAACARAQDVLADKHPIALNADERAPHTTKATSRWPSLSVGRFAGLLQVLRPGRPR